MIAEPTMPELRPTFDRWGVVAIAATILSAAGYALQTILDYVTIPQGLGGMDVSRLVFFGFFEWDGILALLAGAVAVWTGRKRHDWTLRLGAIAISYVVLAQAIQMVWD